MGTNYYFVPKGYEQINLINKSTEEALKNIQDLYVKSVRNVIKYAEGLHPIYKELLNYEYSLDEIYASLRWPVEIPEIHICKISAGWVPCFQTNKHFSTYQEFLAFYDLFKLSLAFFNECLCSLKGVGSSISRREHILLYFKAVSYIRVASSVNGCFRAYNG